MVPTQIQNYEQTTGDGKSNQQEHHNRACVVPGEHHTCSLCLRPLVWINSQIKGLGMCAVVLQDPTLL